MSQDRRSEKRDCIDTERYSRQIRLDGIGTEGQVRHCGDLSTRSGFKMREC